MRRVHAYRDSQGYEVVDWYWQVREHKASDFGCEQIGNGLCAVKVIRYEDWNEAAKRWELEPMVNAATPEQCEVLNGK